MKFAELPFGKNFKQAELAQQLGQDKLKTLINEGLLWQIRPGFLRKE